MAIKFKNPTDNLVIAPGLGVKCFPGEECEVADIYALPRRPHGMRKDTPGFRLPSRVEQQAPQLVPASPQDAARIEKEFAEDAVRAAKSKKDELEDRVRKLGLGANVAAMLSEDEILRLEQATMAKKEAAVSPKPKPEPEPEVSLFKEEDELEKAIEVYEEKKKAAPKAKPKAKKAKKKKD